MSQASPTTHPANGVLLKRAGSPFQADVWRVEMPDGPIVRKSFERHRWLVRRTIGVWMTGRESRNLRDLDGVEGVPRLLGRTAPWTLEMSFMQAQELPSYKTTKSVVTAEFFDELDSIVAQMHARGISHGDLGRRNLLWQPETGRPVLLDFAQSISRRDWLLRPILPLAYRFDRVKLLTMRGWYLDSESFTAEQQAEASRRAPKLMRLGRFLRRGIYRPIKRWWRGDEQVIGRRRKRHESPCEKSSDHGAINANPVATEPIRQSKVP